MYQIASSATNGVIDFEIDSNGVIAYITGENRL